MSSYTQPNLIQERLQTVSNNTIPSHTYARYSDYNAMTDYTFAENEFGVIATSMCSYCPPILSNVEYRVINKIISRSVRFHKDNILLPMRHLTEGVFQGDECIDQPIPSDKKTIQKAIDSLEKKGLIKMVLDKTCYPFINRCVVLVEKIKELFTMPKLKIGKKHKENSGGRNSPRVGVEKYPSNSKNINSENKDKDQKHSVPSDRKDSLSQVEEVQQQVKKRSRAKRKEALSTKRVFSGRAFAEVWNAASAEYAQTHSITVSKMTNSEQFIAGNTLKNNPSFQKEDWSVYLKDVILNWNDYKFHLGERFKAGGRKIPSYPVFAYFNKMHKHFLSVYLDHRIDKGQGVNIKSDARKIKNLEKEVEELRNKNKELKLQSISKTNSNDEYLNKVKNGYRPQRQKVKQTEKNSDEFDWGNLGRDW